MREIMLPRSLDIAVVRAVATDILAALADGALTLDASAVTRIDAAGLQLLCVAMATARATGARIHWKSVPAVLREGAHTLALGEVLGLAPARTENA